MKKFLLLLIFNSQFLILNSYSQSPDWLWAKTIGGTNDDRGHSIAIDPANGDVYTTGLFWGTADFDPGAGVFNLTSAGSGDIFISKLDSSGNFVWAKQMGGINLAIGQSIAIDAAGNRDVYITGDFLETVDFDPGVGVFNLTSAGSSDIFISKLDSSGNFVWAKQMGEIDADLGNSIVVDPAGSGDAYITGSFQGTVDFDPGMGIFNLTADGGIYYDIFISKLDGLGNFVWAKRIGGALQDYGESIAIDPAGSGDCFITGVFHSTVDFDPGPGIFNLTSAGFEDIFISKLDASGNFVWAKAMGGANTNWSNSIAIDPGGSGDVYTTGYFSGTVDFDPDTSAGSVFNLTSVGFQGHYDIFISKLDSSGNFVWAKQISGTDNEAGASIVIDPSGSGDVYTTGYFSGTVDFDPDTSVGSIFNLTSTGQGDIFVSKLDNSGNFEWAKTVGGTFIEYGTSIASDASGHVHVTGYFSTPSINFGSTTLTNPGNYNMFIAKLDTVRVTGINDVSTDDSGSLKLIGIFPNPFSESTVISFSLSQSQNVFLKIFDVSGRLVSILADGIFEAGKNEIILNAEEINAGIYFLQLQTAEIIKTEKLIITK